MGEGLRGLHGPFQVICVLAAVTPTAAISRQFGPAERASSRRVSNKLNFGSPGERLNANPIIPANLCTTHLTLEGDEQSFCDIGA
jgi:hypothetical protein